MKTSKHTGSRTVRRIDEHTVAVTQPGAPVCYYHLQQLQRGRYIVTKVDAENRVDPGSRPYTVNVSPASCTCDGHKYGYACRHICMIAALEAKKAEKAKAKKVAVA